MQDLPSLEWNRFGSPTFQDGGWISLLRGVHKSTDQQVGLRVASRMLEEVERGKPRQEHEPWVRQLEAEAQTLYNLNDAGLPVPRFIGSGVTNGIGTPLEHDRNQPYMKRVDNGLPFYAREWINGQEIITLLDSDVLKAHGNTFITQALDFGVKLEEMGLTYNTNYRPNFVAVGDKLVFVKPSFVLSKRQDREHLYNFLWQSLTYDIRQQNNLPYTLGNVKDASSIKMPALREVIEGMKSGGITSFADLREPLLKGLFPEVVDNLGYAIDPETGLYRPKSEIPLRGQEAYGTVQQDREADLQWLLQDAIPEAEEELDVPSFLRRRSGSRSRGFFSNIPPVPAAQVRVVEPYTPLKRKRGRLKVDRGNGTDVFIVFDNMKSDLDNDILEELSYSNCIPNLQGIIGRYEKSRGTVTREVIRAYNNLWKFYSRTDSDNQRKLRHHLERFEEFVTEPSLVNTVSGLMDRFNLDISPITSSDIYNQIRFAIKHPAITSKYLPKIMLGLAKDHPALAAGTAGLLISELSQVSTGGSLSVYGRLVGDVSFASAAIGLRYLISGLSNGRKSNFMKALSFGAATVIGLVGGSFLEYQEGQRIIQRIDDREQARATAPSPTQVPSSTLVLRPTSTIVPASTNYFGDPISGISTRQPRKGDTYTLELLGYDKTHSPTLLLKADGVNIFVPCTGLDNKFYEISNRLKGNKIELTSDPVGEYRKDNLQGYILLPTMVKAGHQTLVEVCK